ncbi:JmjC domain-containing protein [Rugamonas sp. CCM 8940]|uniref:cupin domain-containing protein n=1 Tax=Rugamonas sp. CCM 8940 TaxID=2765359 RepID=UPI0018F37F6A|nr:cupin domain-containing protein [Rugamonas sp. CCM 8940]MBJ7309591.1 cupin domain-containing protein [Rugamonas sp. CCM 8940]
MSSPALTLANVSIDDFLSRHWQQQPLVIRRGFAHFADPISPDELAGLACEEQVESRLVYRRDGQWQAEHGPFDAYERLGERDWTLIVQAANHWSAAVAELVKPFAFLPKWRLDDVMISYATPGGGVGPHIDRYDVFICQGSGRRRWRVGARGPHREFAAHAALLHCEPFEPIIDVELLPGDILYIPPGFPHDGVTLEASMSFSVGFRSKSASELLSALADHLLDKELGNALLSDPGRPAQRQQGRVDARDLARLRGQMQAMLDDEVVVADAVGAMLSRNKCQLDLQPLEPPFAPAELLACWADGGALRRTGGLRCFYLDRTVADGVCYIDGTRYAFGPACRGAVLALCDNDELSHAVLAAWLEQHELVLALTQWVNRGYWYFDD